MADRTVTVRLRAVTTEFQSAMAKAGQSVESFGSGANSALDSAGKKAEALGIVGKVMGGALVLGAGLAAKSFMDFDRQMSNVKAVSGATAGEMDRLREAAIQAGADTAFSASEAALAQAELARAGIVTSDILGGALTGSLDLAAAGGLDLAQASTIAAQAMNIFGLGGADVSHIADVLAAGANKSAADVQQLGDALRQGGLLASQTGLSLEDTVGALSAFADNALIGSDAGTSLKSMLQRLTPESAKAKQLMDDLGLSAYDAQGNFVGLEEFAGRLQTAMSDLTPEARNAAMGVIFGSDAVRAANIVYELGEDGIRDYIAAVGDSGAASRMAATQMDNLAGDLEELRGSVETALIQGGSSANDILRALAQNATGFVNAIGGLPTPLLGVGLGLGAITGAALLVLPSVAKAKVALVELGLTADTTRGKLALLGRGAGIAALAGISLQAILAEQALDDLVDSVARLSGAARSGTAGAFEDLEAQLAALVAKRDELTDITSWSMDKAGHMFGIGIRTLAGVMTGDIDGVVEDLQGIDRAAQEARAALTQYIGDTYRVMNALETTESRAHDLLNEASQKDWMNRAVMGYRHVYEHAIALGEAQAEGSVAMRNAADATLIFADASATAEDRLSAFGDAIDGTIGLLLGWSDAKIAAHRSIKDLVKSLKENGDALRGNSTAALDNREAFNRVIEAGLRLAEQKLEETNSVEEADAVYQKHLRSLLRNKALTDSQREALKKLISEGFDQLPQEVTTNVNVTGVDTAISNIMSVINYLDRLPAEKRTAIKTEWYGTGDYGNRASGGPVTRGRPYYVGEMGREVFVPAVHGHVIPAHQVTAAMTAQTSRAASVDNSRRFTIEQVTVVPAPQERAEDSLPRALRRMAFVAGLDG